MILGNILLSSSITLYQTQWVMSRVFEKIDQKSRIYRRGSCQYCTTSGPGRLHLGGSNRLWAEKADPHGRLFACPAGDSLPLCPVDVRSDRGPTGRVSPTGDAVRRMEVRILFDTLLYFQHTGTVRSLTDEWLPHGKTGGPSSNLWKAYQP